MGVILRLSFNVAVAVSLSRHSSDYDGKSVDVGAVVEAAAVRVDDMVAVMGVVVG